MVKSHIILLSKFKLHRALVTELGNMVGFVSLRDMTVRYARAERELKKEQEAQES